MSITDLEHGTNPELEAARMRSRELYFLGEEEERELRRLNLPAGREIAVRELVAALSQKLTKGSSIHA